VEVIHQPQQQRFVVYCQGDEAVLSYRLAPNNTVDFYRTYVPESARGTGIAEALVRKGLAWARSQALEVSASCWYVEKFLSRA
jgi:hypothetical protein